MAVGARDLITHAVAAMVAKNGTLGHLVSAMLTSHNSTVFFSVIKLRLISNYKGIYFSSTSDTLC